MQTFDATNIPPQQGFGGHPPGTFPFVISNTFGKANKDGNGYHFVVELQSDVGRIENRYNLWNQNAQAVEIANKELSALCHSIGIFRLNFPTNQDGTPNLAMFGAEIRGGRGRMIVAPQKNNPDYMEVSKVFDANGNEPGKPVGSAGAVQPQPPQNQQPPLQQQPGGGWGAPTQQPQQPAQQAPQGWGNNSTPANTQAPPVAPPTGGWQQPQQQAPNQAPPNTPPWGQR